MRSVGCLILYGFNGYYGYFCSNTDFHGVSRNLCSSASVFFRVFRVVCFIRTRSLTEFHGILFICIRVIRVIRGLICSVRILRILRIFLPICLRVFPCVPCSLFYSNTDFHGISRSFIHQHPCDPCDPYSSLRSSASV